MSLKHKTFAMSMYVNMKDLLADKAAYYMNEAEKLQMELVVSQEQTAHLERVTLTLSRKLEAAERLLERHEEG